MAGREEIPQNWNRKGKDENRWDKIRGWGGMEAWQEFRKVWGRKPKVEDFERSGSDWRNAWNWRTRISMQAKAIHVRMDEERIWKLSESRTGHSWKAGTREGLRLLKSHAATKTTMGQGFQHWEGRRLSPRILDSAKWPIKRGDGQTTFQTAKSPTKLFSRDPFSESYWRVCATNMKD